MAKDSAARPKRHLGAQSVSGIRRSTGRAATPYVDHYLDRASARELGREIDRALDERQNRRATPAPRPGKVVTVGEHRALARQADEARRVRACGPATSLTRKRQAARTLPVCIRAACDDASLTPSQFRVYAHLARMTDRRTTRVECGVEDIAAKCKLHAETVRACLKYLFARRMIEIHARPGLSRTHRMTDPAAWLTPPSVSIDLPSGAARKRPGFADLNFRRPRAPE